MATLVYDEFSTRCATKLDKVPPFSSEYSGLKRFTSGKLFQAKYFLGYLGGLVFDACRKTDTTINSVVVFVGKIFISSNYRCVTTNASISSSSFIKMWLPLFCALYVPSEKNCNITVFPPIKPSVSWSCMGPFLLHARKHHYYSLMEPGLVKSARLLKFTGEMATLHHPVPIPTAFYAKS